MAQNGLIPVSYKTHGHRFWRRITSYEHARSVTVCPVVETEILEVAAAFPMAFRATGEIIEPVAILSMAPEGANPFVSANGAWLAAYIPSLLRCPPFLTGPADRRSPNDTPFRLMVDEASGLVTDDPQDEAFFDANGDLAPELQRLRSFFQARLATAEKTRRLCVDIDKMGLLAPLTQHQGCRFPPGFKGIDPNVLDGLSQSQSAGLANSGALRLIHAHQVSLSHSAWLTQAQRPAAVTPQPDHLHGISTTSEFLKAMANARDTENTYKFQRLGGVHADM